MTKALMIQGCGSNVGKSLFVAGLVRACRNRGLRVLPFKPQNMSNNAAVTEDGGEIGRAQALQARAAGVAPSVHMNPVLLKPHSESGAQVVVQGQVRGALGARDYLGQKPNLLGAVLDSFGILAGQCDIIIVEGAGSPAEVNLRAGDIANMGFARAANVPVLLLGDIDRGGVIAQIVGTKAVIDPDDSAMIRGFAINKFRGDVRLFDGGLAAIEQHTDWPSMGVLTWFKDAWRLPAEDAQEITSHGTGKVKIAVPVLSRIANFDDLDPLANEPDVTIDMVHAGRPLPMDADLILIPGTKSTIADLAFFRAQGWDIDLAAHIRRGGAVMGICGGYQMLGTTIVDDDGRDGQTGVAGGLGHLDVQTVMQAEKQLSLVQATFNGDIPVEGYEIHLGQTTGPDCDRAWLRVGDTPHGAANATGQIMGCYLHGLFASDDFRKAFLARLGGTSQTGYWQGVEDTLDALAAQMERELNIDGILALAGDVALA